MYSWVVRLDTRSAVSPCSSNSRISPEVRLGFLLAIVFWVPEALLAQLTTGTIEGTSFGMDGHPPPGGGILITDGVRFRTLIHSNSRGEFILTLPYGQYRLSGDFPNRAANSGATVFVAPLQTTRLDLVIGASGAIRGEQLAARTPGIWTDAPSGRLYPGAIQPGGCGGHLWTSGDIPVARGDGEQLIIVSNGGDPKQNEAMPTNIRTRGNNNRSPRSG